MIYNFFIYYNQKDMELNYHLLEYKLCNETSMANKPENYKIDVQLIFQINNIQNYLFNKNLIIIRPYNNFLYE